MTEEKTNLPRMRTIREIAKLGILSETACGRCKSKGNFPVCSWA